MSDGQSPNVVAPRLAEAAGSLGVIDPEAGATAILASSDVALVLDKAGTILNVGFGSEELARDVYRDWIGRNWAETLTIESRPKIEDLLKEAKPSVATRWRQVNYPAHKGPDVPVRFAAVRLGAENRILAVGRDLRALAALQQRLAEAQQAMEREYARIRGAERRYRVLFQLSNEAVLIVDAGNLKVTEANPAAGALLGRDLKKLVGQTFETLFDAASAQATRSFVAALRVAPRVDNVHAQLAESRESLLLSGSLFRQESASFLLVIISRLESAAGVSGDKANLLRVVENLPDAVVTVDSERRVQSANAAFLDLVQCATEEQVRGEPIEKWIGRPGVDLDVLFANLAAHGAVRHFSTILRSQFGATEDVEITAVAPPGGAQPCIGLAIRSVGWRTGSERLGGRELPKTVEQFTDLVGRVPLKNLVRETTDLIERLCIEAALELTHDNRASAAEILGLSRQGLYAKLRRYGLGDLDGDGVDGDDED